METLEVSKELFQSITDDVVEGTKAAGLIYVSDKQPGFTRKRAGDKFLYFDGDKKIEDKEQLARIKSLVLPPAWEKVWICKLPDGHLQATGYDKLNRKQYKYHPLWMSLRNQAKFSRLQEFGTKLPLIRERLEKDLALPGLPQNKVLAAMVCLLERINIRVGNTFYEKLYGSFGLTTLKNHHITINGNRLQLMFKGKKGVRQNITLKSKRLAKIIQGCKEIPGKELFEYYDEEGTIHSIDSGMLNSYIRAISGGDFTAKDFRTWAGTTHALLAFSEVGSFENKTEMSRKIPAALDIVAKQLGNTRAVCKKYYIHPLILDLYEQQKLEKYINGSANQNGGTDKIILMETILLKILKDAE